jgi:exonuclease III
MSSQLRIATLNVNGFLQARKHYDLLQHVIHDDLDIVCIQESHISTLEIGIEIEHTLKCKAVWGFGTSKSCGTAILIFNINHKIEKFEYDIGGRFLYMDITILDKPLRIINVYAPNSEAERKQFFLDLAPYFICNRDIVFCGDFNCILDSKLDKVGGNLDRGFAGKVELGDIAADFRLVDLYRHLHPDSISTTWTDPGKNISCRLDRIYVSRSMLSSCLSCTVLPFGSSDHDCVVVSLDSRGGMTTGPGYWKLNSSILKDRAFRVEFIAFWKKLIAGKIITQDLWDHFKISLKHLVTNYCKRKAQDRRATVRDLRNEYYALVSAERRQANNFTEQIANIKHRISEVNNASFAGSKIRSKADSLENSEKPSKFFHKVEFQRGKKKQIHKIIDMDGIECTEAEDITAAFSDFYANLFTSEGIDQAMADNFLSNVPTLSQCDVDSCEGLITVDELRTALSLMKNGKSPGSDGICKEFYVAFFDIVGDVMCSVLNLAFVEMSMSRSQRMSYVTLLCKDLGNSSNLKCWRPISLCNLDYKAMSKVICLRMTKVMDTIINVDQTCSVRGRSIFDNLHLLRNVSDYVEQKNLKCAWISLDMEKAFDRVEYDFLFDCLQAFGFGPMFISWVKIVYTNISSSVIANGFLSYPFPVTRGVRQGCSLSPLLYILALEPLLIHIRAHPGIVGLSLPGTTESCVTTGYADDVTGVLTSEASIGHLLDSCSQYGRASGSKLNMGKSKAIWMGQWENREDAPYGLTWVKKIKICGVWFGVGFSPGEFWDLILAKLDRTLDLWKCRHLSFTGKANIVNVMALSKLWYSVSSAVMPPVYIRKLNSVIFKYFWHPNQMELVSRNTLLHNKLQGGFNMVDIKSKIHSFRLQHIQKLIAGSDAKWTYFSIYWIGMSLRQHNPAFASNLIPHSMDFVTPFYEECMQVYRTFTSAHPDFVFGTSPTNYFYKRILAPTLVRPRIMRLHPEIMFSRVLSNVHHQFVDVSYRDVSWRVVHGVLPVNAYLHPKGITPGPWCHFRGCLKTETVQHLLFDCAYSKGLYLILLPWLDTLSDHAIPYVRGTVPYDFFINPDPIFLSDKYKCAVILYLVSLAKYVVWTVRNLVKHERKVINTQYILVTFLSILRFRILADHVRLSPYLFRQYWLSSDLFCRLEGERVICNFM